MKKQGWKYCPGCRTPIQKDGGCNRMTCTSPGCNSYVLDAFLWLHADPPPPAVSAMRVAT
ncbi:hypothetical protein ARMGADRAFT_1078107 [Armillaria gallica]|uniref:RBR-type E3 ubiquitin transferase n=1 Tax=Armillaria gallica TaxID=47427 RepID=A0A2H3E6S1_ARMGA|nr:hypothetical protein ARMGADRAFT_1078107 [Armillaria gallica]